MIQLVDFKEPGVENDRVVQMAMRETDTSVIARAAVAMDSGERDIVYRNMSKRAGALWAEEAAQAERTVSEKTAADAKEFFVQKLRKYREYYRRRPDEPMPAQAPRLVTNDEEAIIESFVQLVRYARTRGNLSLEDVEIESEYPIARKGIELVVDGWEPMLTQSILDRAKTAHIAQMQRRMEMIIEGVDSLISGDLPIVVEERLRAHLGG